MTERKVRNIMAQFQKKEILKMGLSFPEATTEKMIQTVLNRSKDTDDEVDIRNQFRSLILNVVILSIQKNPQKFYKNFFYPFEESYLGTNRLLQIEDTLEAKIIFMNTVVYVYLFCYNVTKEEISVNYQLNLRKRNKVSRHLIVDTKALTSDENLPIFLEAHFKGDKKILEDCYPTLLFKDQQKFRSFTSFKKAPRFEKEFKKLNERMKLYFLCRAKHRDPNLRIMTMMELLATHSWMEAKEELTQDLLNQYHVSQVTFRMALFQLSQTNKVSYHIVKMFFGEEIYDGKTSASEILLTTKTWLGTLKNFHSIESQEDAFSFKEDSLELILKNHFGYVPVLTENIGNTLFDKLNLHTDLKYDEKDVHQILTQWKETHKDLYDIICLRHGENLKEYHELSQKQFQFYQVALGQIYSELLAKDSKENLWNETKKKIAFSLKQDAQVLNIIKQKRNGSSILEIALAEKIDIETVCTILAENILLFGSEIPNVIREIGYSSFNGIYLLLKSEQFQFLLNHMTKLEIKDWLKEYQDIALKPQVMVLKNYLKNRN